MTIARTPAMVATSLATAFFFPTAMAVAAAVTAKPTATIAVKMPATVQPARTTYRFFPTVNLY